MLEIPSILSIIRYLPSYAIICFYFRSHVPKITFSFQGICHLLTSIGAYCKDSFSGYQPYELPHLDESTSYSNVPSEYENMEMESFYEKSVEDFEERKMEIGRTPFHGHASKTFSEFSDGILVRDLIFSTIFGD